MAVWMLPDVSERQGALVKHLPQSLSLSLPLTEVQSKFSQQSECVHSLHTGKPEMDHVKNMSAHYEP